MTEIEKKQRQSNQLYTPEEVSTWIGVSVQTLAEWRTGRGDVDLPFVKLGRRMVRYRHDDVLRMIEARTVANTVEAFNL